MSEKVLRRLDYKPLDYTATKVDLNLRLDLPLTRVSSKILVKALNPSATSFVLDGQKLNLISLKLNGQVWTDYTLEKLDGPDGFEKLHVDVSSLEQRDEFVLEIENEFNLETNLAMSGIYLSDQVVVSQCEAEGFRRITYYFDRPDCLAEFTTHIEAKDSYQYLLSNGNLIASGKLEDGWHFATWHDPFPKPCYLFACVAGNFDVLDDKFVTKSGREVKLRLFAEPGRLEEIRFAMEAIKRSMKWDEERFDLEYDLDIFMVVGVGYFNAGAMENKGLNIFNESLLIGNKDTSNDQNLFLIDSVIAHEYFHNWTGDRVTCRDWFQLTLKEGLTVFRDQEYSADTVDRTIQRIKNASQIQTYQFNEDKSPLAHPIRPDEVESQDNFYTTTVYEKGAEVIRLLHTLIGEENFQKGMKLYFARHDGKAVTCDDFVDAMADASGYDLSHFRLWYSQSGTPEVTVTTSYDAETKTQDVSFSQVTPPTFDQKDKQPLTLALKTNFLTADGRTLSNLTTTTGEVVPELIVFSEQSYSFTLANVPEKLTIVTNLDFSSPVRIKQELTSAELANIAANSQNLFAKYNAFNEYYNSLYTLNEQAFTANPKVELVVDQYFMEIYQNLFAHALENPGITAEILSFHSAAKVIAGLNKAVDPVVYSRIDKAIKEKIYQTFAERLLAIYQALPLREWEYKAEHFGERALRSELLSLLTITGNNLELVESLENKATCFNDREAVISAVADNDLTSLRYLLDKFAKDFVKHPTSLDVLLTLLIKNAKSVEQIEEILAQAPQFDLNKPNSVYTLMGGLRANYNVFFADNGLSYLKDLIVKIDKNNPAVAAYICRFFARYDSYLEPHRGRILKVLADLVQNYQLSKNTTEILTRTYKASLA
ncbi:aminopeptidase N [Psittacicella hinzii]|nr:aminopeptidase N [Psittacicella hinzii]